MNRVHRRPFCDPRLARSLLKAASIGHFAASGSFLLWCVQEREHLVFAPNIEPLIDGNVEAPVWNLQRGRLAPLGMEPEKKIVDAEVFYPAP